MFQENEKYRVNRAILSISKLRESDEYVYWRKKSPIERLEELEINRQIIYGYGSTPPRLQRILEVTERRKITTSIHSHPTGLRINGFIRLWRIYGLLNYWV
jgi:hypothetical protein